MRHPLISPTSGILYKLHFYLTHRILFLFIQNKSKCKKRYLPILFYILIDKTKSCDKKREGKNLPTHSGLAQLCKIRFLPVSMTYTFIYYKNF